MHCWKMCSYPSVTGPVMISRKTTLCAGQHVEARLHVASACIGKHRQAWSIYAIELRKAMAIIQYKRCGIWNQREVPELNQRPIGLQPIVLPLN